MYSEQYSTTILEINLNQDYIINISLDYVLDSDGTLTCGGFGRVFLLASNGRVVNSFKNKGIFSDTLDAFEKGRRNIKFKNKLLAGKNIIKNWCCACDDCKYEVTLESLTDNNSLVSINNK